jgi:hypothetical protein
MASVLKEKLDLPEILEFRDHQDRQVRQGETVVMAGLDFSPKVCLNTNMAFDRGISTVSGGADLSFHLPCSYLGSQWKTAEDNQEGSST